MKRINPYNMFVGSFIPNWLLQRTEVSSQAKLVYARLCQFAGKDGRAFPTIETIANELGSSKSTVERALSELKEHKLIEAERHGLNKPNSYFFLSHKWIVGKQDTSEMTPLDTSNMTYQDTPNMTYRRESEEENQLRDHAPKARPSKSRKETGKPHALDAEVLKAGFGEIFSTPGGRVSRKPKYDFRNVNRGMAALREMIEHFEKKETKVEKKPKMSIEDRRALLRAQARILGEREK